MGVWLNRHDLMHQRIYEVYKGVEMAMTLGDLPAALFLAVCDDEATAFDHWSTTNNIRSDALRERRNTTGQQTRSLFG